MSWQDISTAPKEGAFLVFMPDEREEQQIQLAVAHPNIMIIGNHFDFDMCKPTHWMPIPPPPATGGER